MNKNLSTLFTVLVVSIMTLALPLSVFVHGDDEEIHGTEGTDVSATVTDDNEFDWNDVRSFTMSENNGDKVDDEFTVTVCQWISNKTTPHKPGGYIFDKLENITWHEENPKPKITISEDDFEEYKDADDDADDTTLTVYVFGEYRNESFPDEEDRDRWAWSNVTIFKPNHPPTPVARVAQEGVWKWTWFNLSEENEVEFIKGAEKEKVTLWFDASFSTDPDDDEVTTWKWDLDGDGLDFGQTIEEKKQNASADYSPGQSWDLGLQVWDERGAGGSEDTLDFTIRIKDPELKPDLIVGQIDYNNSKEGKDNFEVGDKIIVQPYIYNIGQNATEESGFTLLLEYSKESGDPENIAYTLLTRMDITGIINSPQGLKILTCEWDTGGLEEGSYLLRVTADIDDQVEEEYEDNNVNFTNRISLEVNVGAGSPELSVEYVTPDKTTAKINEAVNITVSIKNSGDGDANYVDIYYDIGGEFQYFRSLEVVEKGKNATIVIPFTGDAKGDYVLGFSVVDDGDPVGEKQTVTITVVKEGDDNPDDQDPTTDGDDDSSGFIPGFELMALMGAIVAGTALVSMKRRR